MKPTQKPIASNVLFASPTFSGVFLTLLIVMGGSLLLAFVLRFTGVREDTLPSLAYGLNIVALLIGGYCAGSRAGKKGWYYGGISGLIYSFILAIIGMLAFDVKMTTLTLIYCLAAFGISSVGGMIGVNRSK